MDYLLMSIVKKNEQTLAHGIIHYYLKDEDERGIKSIYVTMCMFKKAQPTLS